MTNGMRCLSVVALALGLALLVGVSITPAQAPDPDSDAEPAYSAPIPVDVQSPDAPSACPAATAPLTLTVERPKFCVYYTNNSITDVQATWAADQVQAYWDQFVAEGFGEPKFSSKLEVKLSDIPGSCNGATGWSSNQITAYAGCFVDTQCAQKVLGHELTHRLQYAHDSSAGAPIQTKFLKEGTARASEDNWFDSIDNWAGALAAPCSSLNQQVNTYLASTNNDVTSNAMRYNSALLWKYASEQYGSTATEPELGINFFDQAYNGTTAGNSGIAAFNFAMTALSAGTDFDGAFKQFAVANWTKDLTGVPDGSYNYVDEDQAGNPAPYGPLAPADGGAISNGSPATWDNQAVSRYGIRYYKAIPDANCQIISAEFHRDDAGPAFYHVVTQQGNAFGTHVEGSGADWTQSFLNDGITQVTAIVGSLNNSSQVDVELACATPNLDIRLPNSSATAYVGPYDAPGKLLAQVMVTSTLTGAPVVGGLNLADFKAEINDVQALVIAGGYIQEQYWLQIQAPAQIADGNYKLEVFMEAPGTANVIASDTNTSSVVYDADNSDRVLVIDRSGSMNWNAKMDAAQAAANFYIDITRNSDGLAVVGYNHDVDPVPPFDMLGVNSTVRTDAKTFVTGLSPSGLTSIGDGLDEAVDQRTASPTGNARCSFVLLSDGMENSSLYWSDVMTDVVNTGCPVTTIAFGLGSNETLMQNIASATGGLAFYNDVFISGARPSSADSISFGNMILELGSIYEYAQAQGEGRQRLLAEKGQVPAQGSPEQVHNVLIDESISQVLFALDWYQTGVEMRMRLKDPNGVYTDSSSLAYDFEDSSSGHLGWRMTNPISGTWQMLVSRQGGAKTPTAYQVLASGRSFLTADLLLPDRVGGTYFTGNRLPIFALVSSNAPISATVAVSVTSPLGTETRVPLYDDGQHGDGSANDGLFGGLYTRLNESRRTAPDYESGAPYPPPTPDDEGSYRVRLFANGAGFQREALGSFSVSAGSDTDSDTIPDTWEAENNVEDPDADPDGDLLVNELEYLNGTDPNDSDTDDGGENDGSEVTAGQDPLDPSDDRIAAPDFFQVQAQNGSVLLTYDARSAYVGLRTYRATNPTGPFTFTLQQPELPLTGVYTDPATNGQGYYYRLAASVSIVGAASDQESGYGPAAIDATTHWSALLASEVVTPTTDPIPPAAIVVITGTPTIVDLDVSLSFIAYADEGGQEAYEDITHMLVGNDPTFLGATWQAFDAVDAPWELAPAQPGDLAHVYVRFRDENDNESVGTEVASILVTGRQVYLPLVLRQ